MMTILAHCAGVKYFLIARNSTCVCMMYEFRSRNAVKSCNGRVMEKVKRNEPRQWKYREEGEEDPRQDGKADMRNKALNTNMAGDGGRWRRLIKNSNNV